MSEFAPKIVDVTLGDSSATSLLDKRNHVAQGANRNGGLGLVAQESARCGHEQGGFDMKRTDSPTMELSSHFEIAAAQTLWRHGEELNIELSNRFHIIGESLSGG